MKITTRGRYAVMALVSLASASRGNPVPIQTIARQESIPEPYLQQLFLRLKRNEAGRFLRWLEDERVEERPDETTAWEQNEYFDFF